MLNGRLVKQCRLSIHRRNQVRVCNIVKLKEVCIVAGSRNNFSSGQMRACCNNTDYQHQ